MNIAALAAPRIGFDRYVSLEWSIAAIKEKSGAGAGGSTESLLLAAGLGAEARKKTRTVLNRLWLEPKPDFEDFSSRGIALYGAKPGIDPALLSWGSSIAIYPFFGKCAEIAGRLLSLQGDFAPSELHRRMAEVFGQREGTRRAANNCMQTMADWGMIEKSSDGKRVSRMPTRVVTDPEIGAWLIEAAARYSGRPLFVSTLQSNPVLFPFILDFPVAYSLSGSSRLDVRQDGAGDQSITLRLEQ